MSSPSSPRQKVLLIGWDSADWKIINALLAGGGMDGIRSLMHGGSHGNLATLEPQLSPMLWTSIATGKMAYHHGVHGFTEVDPVSGGIVPVSAATRKCKTLWEILGQHGLRSHIVSWFATQGERDVQGKMVSNMFCHLKGAAPDADPEDFPPPMPGTYWPEELAAELNPLRVSPHEIDGPVIQPFVPKGHLIDQEKDKRLKPLRTHLAEAYSVHAAATHLMETDPDWDFMAVYYRAIDEISHHFMHYHPPRMEGIPEEDFEIYRHVVSATYRAHDMMLQRLLHLAGPDTTVILCSDHGFHSDHLRPAFTPRVPAGITVWHRNQGVLLAKGPGIAPGCDLHGARLLDIAPTILHLHGLPVGDDMEGRILTEILSENTVSTPIHTIPTWETPDGPAKRRGSLSEEESQALLEQFVALGYIDKISPGATEAAEATHRENQWSLARAHLYSGHHEAALPLLENCFHAVPNRPDFAQTLAATQLQLGLAEEAQATLTACLEQLAESPAAFILKARIANQQGDPQRALTDLESALSVSPGSVAALEIACRSHAQLGQWPQARATAEHLLGLDPTSIQAHNTLTRCHLHARQPELAVETALSAIGYQFASPRAHQLLGNALVQLRQYDEALKAYTNAHKLTSTDAATLESLESLHKLLGQTDQAEYYRKLILQQQLAAAIEKDARPVALRKAIATRAQAREAATAAKQAAATAAEQERTAELANIAPLDFLIVSGLPRSGTSLMMQMLHAAGVEIMHDGIRAADEDNTEGYWEWEEIKALRKNPRIIEQAHGKAIKIISALLPHLPPPHRYRILFMRRPVPEVIDSQWAMLARNGHKPRAEKDHLIRHQETHLQQTLAALRLRKNIQLLEIDYPALVANPASQLPALENFLAKILTNPTNLSHPISPNLHRQKSAVAASNRPAQ